eukprot:16386-Heterococcus_DN1.PRE.1
MTAGYHLSLDSASMRVPTLNASPVCSAAAETALALTASAAEAVYDELGALDVLYEAGAAAAAVAPPLCKHNQTSQQR